MADFIANDPKSWAWQPRVPKCLQEKEPPAASPARQPDLVADPFGVANAGYRPADGVRVGQVDPDSDRG